MKIPVQYNNLYYYWVDTVVMHDEYNYVCAILVSNNGSVFPICVDNIKVVGDDYDFEKNIQKRIFELEQENFQLNEQMRLDAEISRIRSNEVNG